MPARPLQRLKGDQQGLRQALPGEGDRAYEGAGRMVEEPRPASTPDEGFPPDQPLPPEDLEPLQHRGTGHPQLPNQLAQRLGRRSAFPSQGGADPPPEISPRHNPIFVN